MQIKIQQYFIRDLHFEQVTQPQEGDSFFDFDFDVHFYPAKPNEFFLSINLACGNPKEYSVKLTYVFVFNTSEDVNEDWGLTHFPIINAPAIAFPYVRVFVSNLTLNGGYQPIILPSINFNKVQNGKVYWGNKLIKDTLVNVPNLPGSD